MYMKLLVNTGLQTIYLQIERILCMNIGFEQFSKMLVYYKHGIIQKYVNGFLIGFYIL